MKKFIIIALLIVTALLTACHNAAVANEQPVSFSGSNIQTTVETTTMENTTENTEISETETAAETTTAKPAETIAKQTTTQRSTTTTKQHTTTQSETTTKQETTTRKQTTTQKETTTKKPTTTAPPETTQPQADCSYYVSFAKNYGTSIGLHYDSSVTECWDNPIIISATNGSTVERDVKSRLKRYKNVEGFTDFNVWAEKRSDGKYNLYIAYA